jgi:hypothetical protein
MKIKHNYAKRKKILATKEVKQHVFFFLGRGGRVLDFSLFPIAPHFFIPYIWLPFSLKRINVNILIIIIPMTHVWQILMK